MSFHLFHTSILVFFFTVQLRVKSKVRELHPNPYEIENMFFTRMGDILHIDFFSLRTGNIQANFKSSRTFDFKQSCVQSFKFEFCWNNFELMKSATWSKWSFPFLASLVKDMSSSVLCVLLGHMAFYASNHYNLFSDLTHLCSKHMNALVDCVHWLKR